VQLCLHEAELPTNYIARVAAAVFTNLFYPPCPQMIVLEALGHLTGGVSSHASMRDEQLTFFQQLDIDASAGEDLNPRRLGNEARGPNAPHTQRASMTRTKRIHAQ
jgi:hypothetical protein